ncbi:MAG TPA: hypothetical protein VLA29_08335 [Acidimicrobiia bacterium]|nr:hypothetical protein [Acidimicrobiia bacterium]
MRYLAIPIVVVVAVCAVGCTTVNTPATAPDTTAGVTATSTSAPEDTTTSTIAETTTTLDRVAEITAIFEDLERRRLEAIYAGDVEAFRSLFADTQYFERSLAVFDIVEPGEPPVISVEVIEILRDDDECLAVHYDSVTSTGEALGDATVVLQPTDSGYAYLFTNDGRGGWLCEGPHPLSQSS